MAGVQFRILVSVIVFEALEARIHAAILAQAGELRFDLNS